MGRSLGILRTDFIVVSGDRELIIYPYFDLVPGILLINQSELIRIEGANVP
jgi:hypothetical protein